MNHTVCEPFSSSTATGTSAPFTITTARIRTDKMNGIAVEAGILLIINTAR